MVVKPTVTTQAASNKSWRNSGYDATLNGTITDTGGEDCTERGFDWGSSPEDYDQGWNEGPGPFGVGAFDRRDSFHGTVYYRAYAMNSAGYGYGSERSFTPPEIETPTLTTQEATDLSWRDGTYDATLHGTITDTGGEDCSRRGFEWGEDEGGPYPEAWAPEGSFGIGSYEHEDVFSGTVYYRAYAENSAGEGYGNEVSFDPPIMVTTMIGGPLAWDWGTVVPGVSVVPITSDGGLTWIWGLAVGTIVIPSGGPLEWDWVEYTF